MVSRRSLLVGSAVASALATLRTRRAKAAPAPVAKPTYVPVEVPNGDKLPFKVVDGWKELHLVAEPVEHEVAPGMIIHAWGYNGRTPGPVIELVDGDKVRIRVTNKLPERTSVHWHGIFLPNGMDGVAGLNQPHIEPGETYVYEFVLRQHGVFMYHPHSDEMVQMALGMMGMIVVHPKVPEQVDRHFVYMVHEMFVEPGTARPNPMVMNDFNLFTLNGRAYPGTAPLVVRTNQRVRISIGNLSMDSHPIHLHGFAFEEVGTEGGTIPKSARWPTTTTNVPVGATRTIEFVADAPGDWALHCHKSHHTMNPMGHDVPNMLGVKQGKLEGKVKKVLPDYMAMGEKGMGGMVMGAPKNTLPMMTGKGPFGPIEMGGMFTVFKVRDGITSYGDPGWYAHPVGTVAKKESGKP